MGIKTMYDKIYYNKKKRKINGWLPRGLVVKTLPSNAEGAGSIPGQGAKILHASQPKIQKQYCNKFNEDLLILSLGLP